MSRTLFLLLLLIVTLPCLSLYDLHGLETQTEKKNQQMLLVDIGLIDTYNSSDPAGYSPPPSNITMGIYVTDFTYYKISKSSKGIISGGLLHPGLNLIEIKDDDFFKQRSATAPSKSNNPPDNQKRKVGFTGKLSPGINKQRSATAPSESNNIHRFLLTLKRQDDEASEIIEKQISIHIRLEPGKIQSPAHTAHKKENKPATRCKVSMFIDDHLMASAEKKENIRISTKTKNEPVEIDYGKMSMIDGTYPSVENSGVPILPLAALLIKKLVLEKKETSPIRKMSGNNEIIERLTLRFQRVTEKGAKQPVKVEIRFSLDSPPGKPG